MKNLIYILLFSMVLGASCVKSQGLEEFDKGKNFNECLSNCRDYHRRVLNLKMGEGRGFCWNECDQEYQ